MSWYNKTVDAVSRELETNLHTGLSSKEAKKRLSKFGYNRLEQKKRKSLIRRFSEQFSDFMVIILLIAAGISFFTSVLQGETDIVDPLIILVIVFCNALLGLIQESKAQKAIEALQKLSEPTTRVLRDGAQVTIPTEEVVPGDILILEAGDYVPADARLFEAVELKVEESALTGESNAVEKDPALLLGDCR